jgi:16S rRNA pseudouridine516 synthase
VYHATTAEAVTDALVAKLLAGVQLHDEPAPLAAVHCVQLDTHLIEIVLEQGKYHQVKRMLAAAENHCAALQRVQIGQLKLADLGLALGQWCYLDAVQLEMLVA